MNKTLFLLVFGLISSCWAGGASEVGNGGGLAEKNLTYAYLNLPRFVDLCLATPLCRLDADENSVLQKIKESLPSEQSKSGQIVFRSSLKDPKFFMIDGLIRVAKTGDNVGGPIYINSELIYSNTGNKTGKNEFKAMDIPLAVSVLIHELGHHQGIKDHAKLDRLGSKLQILLLTDSERSEFWNSNAALVTYQFNSVHSDDDKRNISAIDELVLENGSELYFLTEKITSKIECPDKKVSSKKQLSIRFYNLHSERGVSFDKSTHILKRPEEAWYVLKCGKDSIIEEGNIELSLVFKKESSGAFIYLPDLIEISQKSCAQNPNFCKKSWP